MKPFELLEHTGDAKLRAHGNTLEEAFGNVIRALTAIATDRHVEGKRTCEIYVEGHDLKALLFALIDELIFRIDTENFLANEATHLTITKNKNHTLTATLIGDDATTYGGNLKAATYSDMKIEEHNGIWTIEAVVDI